MAASGKKLVKSKSGLRIVAVDESETSPFTLAEPPWVPDEQCDHCMQCQGKFDFLKRKHHCRRCGRCFCGTCCEAKVSLPRMCFVDPVRQCEGCTQITKKENKFFENDLKALMNGTTLTISETGDSTDNGPSYTCKLSSDNRHLTFENQNSRRDAILLELIESLQILTSGIDSEDEDKIESTLTSWNTLATGLAMRYKDSCGEMQLLKMVVSPQTTRKAGHAWLAAFQKAFKMLCEMRSTCSTP